MISIKKSKSHLIAAVSTLLIHLLLLGFLTIDFSGGDSSASLSNADMEEFELHLNEILAENTEITPPGEKSLSDQKDKSAENISEKKGMMKQQASSVERTNADEEAREVFVPETLAVPKKELILPVKPDSVIVMQADSAIKSEIANVAKTMNNKTNSKEDRKKALDRYQFYQKNYRSIRNFKIVYPYAIKVKQIMDDLNKKLSTITNEDEKKRLIKETEKTLFKEYESAVRGMSVSQGKLLLKLIARETSETGYEIIKDYKGAIPATFWYGVGKIFGTDLKTEFHKEKEDSLIEVIVNKYKDNDLY